MSRRISKGPVARAHALFDRSPKASRAALLARCERAGINLNTAKTQYQRWLHL